MHLPQAREIKKHLQCINESNKNEIPYRMHDKEVEEWQEKYASLFTEWQEK